MEKRMPPAIASDNTKAKSITPNRGSFWGRSDTLLKMTRARIATNMISGTRVVQALKRSLKNLITFIV
jgi:hypothetical protein